MSEEAQSPDPAKAEAKPAEEIPTADTEKKPGKKAKKKSPKKPKPDSKSEGSKPEGKAEAKSDTKADEAPKESKDSKKEEGKDSDGKNSRRRRSRGGGGSSKPSKPSKKHDPELLAKRAWKIYLAEISEEGVTMIDDSAAKTLARRCFDLAATFLDEQEYHS